MPLQNTWPVMPNRSKFAVKPIDYIIFYFNRLEAISLLPTNPGGHAAYQDTFVSQFLKFYPDPFVLPKSTWDYIVQYGVSRSFPD